MKVFIDESYESSSMHAADDLIEKVRSINNPLICPASGDSTAGLYKEIVEKVKKKQLDVSNWTFVGLDEWIGMNGDDEGSCRYHLDRQLFHPLGIPEEKICFFDGRAADSEKECERVESFIRKHNGIDVAIVGLGINGHVGMNEPGTPREIRSHIAEIHRATSQAGQKYFKKERALTHGLTLGLTNLMESRHVMLLISGAHKAQIAQRVFEEAISEELPTSLLRDHPDFSVYFEPASVQLMHLESQKS